MIQNDRAYPREINEDNPRPKKINVENFRKQGSVLSRFGGFIKHALEASILFVALAIFKGYPVAVALPFGFVAGPLSIVLASILGRVVN